MPFIQVSGVNVNFPFEPYECQEAYMSKVVTCLRDGFHGILESPTGTGKTLCLLCSSLAWLEDKKAQITSQRWKLAQSDPGANALDIYKADLANQLDQAAGSWSGELSAPKIIYASRTHTQLTQAIQELKRTAYQHFKVAVLGSREQMCIHPHVMREESNSAKVHLCRAKVSARSCHFYNNLETGKGNFLNQVHDIEDLVKLGQKHNCCPYYVAKELKTEADIIFMPYNYLLDPKSRKAHGVELQGNIVIFDEAHNLEKICEESASFDLKSSDIAAAIRELQELSEKLLEWVRQEEQGGDMADSQTGLSADFNLREVYELKAMLHDLEEQIDGIPLPSGKGVTKEGMFIFELLGRAKLTFESKNHVAELIDKIITNLTSEGSSSFHSRGAGLNKIADVIKIVFSREPDERLSSNHHLNVLAKAYKVHIQDNDQDNKMKKKKLNSWGAAGSSNKGRTLSYWCFSPGHAMNDLLAMGVKSIILTSGTLSPMSSFKTEMGIEFKVELENPHVIEKHQVWIGTIGKGPDSTKLNSSYEHRFREDYQASLGNAIDNDPEIVMRISETEPDQLNFARVVPQGLLLFFPSYPVMEKCLENWQGNNIWNRIEQYKPIFVEPRNKFEFQTAMLNFYEKIEDPTLNGAIFAAVCRGKVSEGLDFSDRNGRAVVITGLPFPPRMDPKVILKMQFLDDLRRRGGKGLTGQEWYRQQASRAVNQAIGRVIRHKQDFGAIMLCDNRFEGATSKSQLPSWVRPNVTVYNTFGNALRDIMMFFKTAQKLLPAPRTGKSRQKAVAPGCQGAYFQTTISRPGSSGPVERASAVASHVPSLKERKSSNTQSDMSLAKLKIQYETPGPSGVTHKPKGLLDALSGSEKGTKDDVETLSNTQIPSYQKDLKLSQPLQKHKKKIIIKGSKSMASGGVNKDSLQSAELYLVEVKQTLSSQSYSYFTKALTSYKKTGDYTSMVTALAEIFTDSQHNYHLFRKFYRFVRPQHKAAFDESCRDIIGQGCGYKPEDSHPKKRTTSSDGNEGAEKKRKIEEKLLDKTAERNTKAIGKNEPLISGYTSKHLDTKTHLNTGSGVLTGGVLTCAPDSTTGDAKEPSRNCVKSIFTSTSSRTRPNLFETLSKPPETKSSDEKAHTEGNKASILGPGKTDAVLQPCSSNITKTALPPTSRAVHGGNESTGGKSNSQESQRSLGSDDLFKENSDNSSSSQNGPNSDTFINTVSDPTSDIPESSAGCKSVITETTKEDLKAYIFTHRGHSGYKCSRCKDDAIIPLKAPCGHVCCIECWKESIRVLKQCPVCGLKVKRKHLSRLFFNSGTDTGEAEGTTKPSPPLRQT